MTPLWFWEELYQPWMVICLIANYRIHIRF
jgi:hypothetical protein